MIQDKVNHVENEKNKVPFEWFRFFFFFRFVIWFHVWIYRFVICLLKLCLENAMFYIHLTGLDFFLLSFANDNFASVFYVKPK